MQQAFAQSVQLRLFRRVEKRRQIKFPGGRSRELLRPSSGDWLLTLVRCSRLMEEAVFLVREKGVRHPYFIHHLSSYCNLRLAHRKFLDQQSGICPKLAEVKIDGEILK